MAILPAVDPVIGKYRECPQLNIIYDVFYGTLPE